MLSLATTKAEDEGRDGQLEEKTNLRRCKFSID